MSERKTFFGMEIIEASWMKPDEFAIVSGEHMAAYRDGQVITGPIPGTMAYMRATAEAKHSGTVKIEVQPLYRTDGKWFEV